MSSSPGNNDGMLVETHSLSGKTQKRRMRIRPCARWPSTITLRQTIDELLEIDGKNKMPGYHARLCCGAKALLDASRAREVTLGRFRTLLEAQLGSSHQQMQTFNQRPNRLFALAAAYLWRRPRRAVAGPGLKPLFYPFPAGKAFYRA